MDTRVPGSFRWNCPHPALHDAYLFEHLKILPADGGYDLQDAKRIRSMLEAQRIKQMMNRAHFEKKEGYIPSEEEILFMGEVDKYIIQRDK